MQKYRHWIGTSYSVQTIPYDERVTKCVTYQLEQCPNTGRLHLQFAISFLNARTLSGVQHFIGDHACHLESARNPTDAHAYCNKEETRLGEPCQFGTPPAEKRTAPDDWQSHSDNELWQLYPHWMLRNHGGVRAYRSSIPQPPPSRAGIQAIILWGSAGTFKSTAARQWLGNHYVKPPGPFWIGYNGESSVLFDDYYSAEKYDDLLRWISENTMYVNVKGSQRPLMATKFAFTSNLNPKEWHNKIENKEALWRRITKCYFCTQNLYLMEQLN